jgi:UDP-glucose 4-epimerase
MRRGGDFWRLDVGDLYLVTGGAGFIGSHVAARLLELGHEVRILDNFSTGRRQNLDVVDGQVAVFEGDVRSYERAHNAVKGCDYVVHLAALPSVPRSVQDPLTTSEVNITGTLNVLLAARDAGVRRVVLASSSSVYGATETMPKHEGLVPAPISPYAVSKLAAEQYARAFWSVYALGTVSLRYFNVFGPRQDPTSQYSGVVPRFMRLALEGEDPVVFGDGSQSRDFTYVSNVVDATLSAAVAAGAEGSICNVGCGAPKTVLDLVAAISRVAEREISPRFAPPRMGDVKHSFADIGAARETLGYEPTVDFETGVALTFQSVVDEVGNNAQRA